MRYFFISDMHFHHKLALDWRTEFSSLDQMNNTMVENWNKIVSPQDVVYNLGDEHLGNAQDSQKLLRSLNGYKILIRGNHSNKSDNWYKNAGFSEIHNKIYLISPSRPATKAYILTHYPIPYRELEALEHTLQKKILNIHGHIHNSTDHTFTGEDVWEHPEFYLNVCVEKINYTPLELGL